MPKGKPTELRVTSFMLLHGVVAALNCTSPSLSPLFDELDKNLFREKHIRPVRHFSDPLNVTVDITVVGILGVDEKSQALTILIWQVLVGFQGNEWDIYGLSWDEKDCGPTKVSILRENLWVPDIHISEFMEEDQSQKTAYVYLYNTGHVVDDKPVRVVSSCKLVIYTFPFDVQNCSLTFGSYIHFASDIRMIQGTTAEQTLQQSQDVIETNGEWELADITVAPSTLALEDGSYSEIKFYIILRRRPILYVVNLLIPSCFLVTVDLFSFLLPPQTVDRSSFKMTLILGYSVFLLIMNDLLPVTGNETPILNVFLSITFALMVGSLLETVFITNIQFSSRKHSVVPHWLSVLMLQYLAVIVCLPPKKPNSRVTVFINPSTAMNISTISPRGHQSISGDSPTEKPPLDSVLDELRTLSKNVRAIRLQMDQQRQESNTSQDWQMIAIVIDRLLFGLYIVIIVTTYITITAMWVWNNSYAA